MIKTVLFAMGLYLMSSSGHAQEDINYDAMMSAKFYKGCIYESSFFNYVLIKKLGENRYQLVSDRHGALSGHAVIDTTKTTFERQGRIRIKMEHVESKKIIGGDGFPVVVEMWRECE